MEPENEGLEDEFPFQTGDVQVPMLNFGGVIFQDAFFFGLPSHPPLNCHDLFTHPSLSHQGSQEGGNKRLRQRASYLEVSIFGMATVEGFHSFKHPEVWHEKKHIILIYIHINI